MGSYLLGIDIGTSSVKASLVEVASGKTVASASAPAEEMKIISHQPGWAEQHPDTWWIHTVESVKLAIKGLAGEKNEIVAIGIAYQMHGLVVVDKSHQPLRPSIIWCDSRAVSIGEEALQQLGNQYCLQNLLNSPGNFTASKLKWVKDNEPEVYKNIAKVMLPGDYIALRLTGEVSTTAKIGRAHV